MSKNQDQDKTFQDHADDALLFLRSLKNRIRVSDDNTMLLEDGDLSKLENIGSAFTEAIGLIDHHCNDTLAMVSQICRIFEALISLSGDQLYAIGDNLGVVREVDLAHLNDPNPIESVVANRIVSCKIICYLYDAGQLETMDNGILASSALRNAVADMVKDINP